MAHYQHQHLIYNQHLYLDLGGEKKNSPPNDDFRSLNFVPGNKKVTKKWQCSQNLDLNPTCNQSVSMEQPNLQTFEQSE